MAFTPLDKRYNTIMFEGQLVEHMTTWLTMNLHKGCSLGCAYCFRVNWHPASKPTQAASVEESLARLVQHTDFIAHETPLSFNISSTDCMLPKVKKSTLEALSWLESNGFRNPVGLVTKLGLKHADLDFIGQLRYVKPIVFVSLAFLPNHIEPVPVLPRIRNLINLKYYKIPSVLYLRPIVPGWNDSKEILTKALLLGQRYTNAICYSGLRTSLEIVKAIKDVEPEYTPPQGRFENDLDDATEELLHKLYVENKITVAMYRHTSCAISYILGISNYNELYRNREKNCVESCPTSQQYVCNKHHNP